jgi:hypothetical protein
VHLGVYRELDSWYKVSTKYYVTRKTDRKQKKKTHKFKVRSRKRRPGAKDAKNRHDNNNKITNSAYTLNSKSRVVTALTT